MLEVWYLLNLQTGCSCVKRNIIRWRGCVSFWSLQKKKIFIRSTLYVALTPREKWRRKRRKKTLSRQRDVDHHDYRGAVCSEQCLFRRKRWADYIGAVMIMFYSRRYCIAIAARLGSINLCPPSRSFSVRENFPSHRECL